VHQTELAQTLRTLAPRARAFSPQHLSLAVLTWERLVKLVMYSDELGQSWECSRNLSMSSTEPRVMFPLTAVDHITRGLTCRWSIHLSSIVCKIQ